MNKVDELLLDVLYQACGDGFGKRQIDNDEGFSAYEEACDYLEKKGILSKVNSRIYNIIEED